MATVLSKPKRGGGQDGPVPHISIGILAWNEEEAIEATIQSLFQQSLFENLARCHRACEIVCIANGCTDNTAAVARRVFEARRHPHRPGSVLDCRVVEVAERGKCNAWNLFVHTHSARSARFLYLMDGDIVLRHPDTLWNLYDALLEYPEANVSVDQPLKDIALKPRKSVFEVLSLATSRMTQTGTAQLTGQLYCIIAGVARAIVLPRDLLVEDGFIKAMVCTDLLLHPANLKRVVRAENASHVFQAYSTLRDILKNQKRQMMSQTILHLLVDKHLATLPENERADLTGHIRKKERDDPLWLRRLIGAHVRSARHFWNLFPGVLTFRFERLAKLKGGAGVTDFLAALAGSAVAVMAGLAAHRSLKRGYTDYWPDTKSPGLGSFLDPSGLDRERSTA